MDWEKRDWHLTADRQSVGLQPPILLQFLHNIILQHNVTRHDFFNTEMIKYFINLDWNIYISNFQVLKPEMNYFWNTQLFKYK